MIVSRNPSDGHLDEVHAIRDRTRADIVMLLREDGDGKVNGLAFPMGIEATTFARHAFGVSVVDAIIFAHELGHIMGLFHDRYDACEHHTSNPRCPSPVVQPYAYGYVNQEAFESGAAESKRWRTIMSLNSQCVDNTPSFDCTHVSFFSDPDNSYPDDDGDPMGKSGTQTTTALDGPANAAQALNDTRDTVAEFREGRAVKVSFAAETYAVTEGGSVTVTVQLDAAPGRELVIPLTATSTTGAWPGDYTITPTRLTFGANQTSRTVTFRATQDSRQEDQETVTLGFGAPLPDGVTVNTAATAHATTSVTVTDDSDSVTAAPSVSTVALISAPEVAYALGEEIVVAVVFTKPIVVTGTPQLSLEVGGTTRTADCTAAASEVLTCTYTVVADETDTDGVSIAANALTLPSGVTIKDADDQNATGTALNHTAVPANSRHRVDGDTPDLASVTAHFDSVTLTYDEDLDGTSVPRASAFTVTAGSRTPSVESVGISGMVVTLTLGSDVNPIDSVTLDYSPPAGTPSVQDAAGNLAATLSGQTVTNTTPAPMYDTADNDRLIEITTLAQLDAIRHDLDGDGTPTTAGATAYAEAFQVRKVVCTVSGGCDGYELMADLDFDTDDDGDVDADDTYWNDGGGWAPIITPWEPASLSPRPSRATATPSGICSSISPPAPPPWGCSATCPRPV